VKAKEKAEDMAKALSVNLGKVILIDEVHPTESSEAQLRSGRINPFNPVLYNTVMCDEVVVTKGGVGTGFFAQTISITSVVYVTFEIK